MDYPHSIGAGSTMVIIAFNLYILRTLPPRVSVTFLGLYNLVGFLATTVGAPIFGFTIDIAGLAHFSILTWFSSLLL